MSTLACQTADNTTNRGKQSQSRNSVVDDRSVFVRFNKFDTVIETFQWVLRKILGIKNLGKIKRMSKIKDKTVKYEANCSH